MNLKSLYNDIADKKINVSAASEPPPIIESDVNYYANILSKKSYLNENKSLLRENVPAAAPTPAAQQIAPQASTNSITNLLQNVQKKYNTSTPQEKAILVKVLTSLI